ncbi:Protein wos2 [Smittium culicis]|uniref:Protein wos2 n=1 Tax=Smittium culicis TaxID=133412 RepID=A0A1R1YNV4_9FUNG|nr:Protein wos2 [Smittium culicis]
MSATINKPTVLWAQRAELVYLTINLSDCKVSKFDLTEDKLEFAGSSNNQEYAFEIEFFDKVNVEESKKAVGQRSIFLHIAKKTTDAPYWPRLQKGSKLNFVKTDFNLWVDEDESDDEAPASAANPMMPPGMDFSQFGGMGGMPGMDALAGMGGMPGMGGMGGMPGMDALAGMGGMGGMPNMDDILGAQGDAESSGDDEDDESSKAEPEFFEDTKLN